MSVLRQLPDQRLVDALGVGPTQRPGMLLSDAVTSVGEVSLPPIVSDLETKLLITPPIKLPTREVGPGGELPPLSKLLMYGVLDAEHVPQIAGLDDVDRQSFAWNQQIKAQAIEAAATRDEEPLTPTQFLGQMAIAYLEAGRTLRAVNPALFAIHPGIVVSSSDDSPARIDKSHTIESTAPEVPAEVIDQAMEQLPKMHHPYLVITGGIGDHIPTHTGKQHSQDMQTLSLGSNDVLYRGLPGRPALFSHRFAEWKSTEKDDVQEDVYNSISEIVAVDSRISQDLGDWHNLLLAHYLPKIDDKPSAEIYTYVFYARNGYDGSVGRHLLHFDMSPMDSDEFFRLSGEIVPGLTATGIIQAAKEQNIIEPLDDISHFLLIAGPPWIQTLASPTRLQQELRLAINQGKKSYEYREPTAEEIARQAEFGSDKIWERLIRDALSRRLTSKYGYVHAEESVGAIIVDYETRRNSKPDQQFIRPNCSAHVYAQTFPQFLAQAT